MEPTASTMEPLERGEESFARFDTYTWHSIGLTVSRCRFSAAAFDDGLFERVNVRVPKCLATAVRQRKADFLAGRLCAAHALNRIGIPGSVGFAADRSPVWPAGAMGSITHSGGIAMAAALDCKHTTGVGIDIESRAGRSVASAGGKLVLNADEKTILATAGIPNADCALLAFSIKESFFKAAYPQVKRFFGFSAVRIRDVDRARQLISLEISEALSTVLKPSYRVLGAYSDDNPAFIKTAVVL